MLFHSRITCCWESQASTSWIPIRSVKCCEMQNTSKMVQFKCKLLNFFRKTKEKSTKNTQTSPVTHHRCFQDVPFLISDNSCCMRAPHTLKRLYRIHGRNGKVVLYVSHNCSYRGKSWGPTQQHQAQRYIWTFSACKQLTKGNNCRLIGQNVLL